ncbi:hypothetical protein D1627_05610 [Pontibacter oryzae]|uniref:Uncharacterized protein n=1 Tax=Pontibacter oryzae TaxID=2304593 RepID=A0A399SEU7_9BACT|nr:hypothetical protein D1627_05610 [Pontibacter oryzae]
MKRFISSITETITLNNSYIMKALLYKLLMFLFVAALFSACQRQTSCPAYASHKAKPMQKPTFLKDLGR